MGSLDNSFIVIGAFVVLAFIIVGVFFLITQQNILRTIRPQNRTMSAGEVWLQLIPFLIWFGSLLL